METVYCVFHSYIYQDNDSGYAIIRARLAPGQYIVCEPLHCIAPVGLTAGTPLLVSGDYRSERCGFGRCTGERSFLFTSMVQTMPQDEASAVAFVENMEIRGIASANARHIIDVTGPDIEAYFRRNPDAADFKSHIPSLTLPAAEAFIRRIMTTTTQKKILDFMHPWGARYEDVFRLYSAIIHDVGHDCTIDEVMDVLRPHRLNAQGTLDRGLYYYCAKAGISFDVTDTVAKQLGYRPYHPERLKSLLMTVMQKLEAGGHIWSSLETIYNMCQSVTQMSAYPRDIISRWALYAAVKTGHGLFREEACGERIYLESSWFDEHAVVKHVRRIQATHKVLPYYNSIISDIENERGVTFSRAQRDCFGFLEDSGIHIVTGGAGTGKTTIISGLLTAYTRMNPDAKVALCAPTGRAAQRMTELCSSYGSNVRAYTIHKLLDFLPFDGQSVPTFDENNPLDADMLIVDEMSMVDLHLFSLLVQAVKDGALVILCGDVSQLPSVAAGKVFWDLIDSQQFNTVRLTSNYRQANAGNNNNIIENADKINRGLWTVKCGPDFEIVSRETDSEMRDAVLQLVQQRPGCTVLTTVREGDAGIYKLNEELQPILNHSAGSGIKYGRFAFNEGDQIIMTRNNYEVGYVNGDVGVVTEIGNNQMTVRLGEDEHVLEHTNFKDVALAYAMTIHKSQGSEYDDVIVVLPSSAPHMLARNLLYTAVTRAKRHVTIVAQEGAIRFAVHNVRNANRRTTLKELLCS